MRIHHQNFLNFINGYLERSFYSFIFQLQMLFTPKILDRWSFRLQNLKSECVNHKQSNWEWSLKKKISQNK